MSNENIDYKWTKITNGMGNVAIVNIDVISNSLNQNEIITNYSGEGFTTQGSIEEVPNEGYNYWKLAAKLGLEYAFSLTKSYWIVTINKIEGVHTGTNPAIVGYTVLRAFFAKINQELDPQKTETLENFILSSWTKPYKELIPDFFNLTFTEYAP
jgi:hypothetical protein